jgi:hypothetical protein
MKRQCARHGKVDAERHRRVYRTTPPLGGVPWIFGGAHDAQTPTGCVVVVAVMTSR